MGVGGRNRVILGTVLFSVPAVMGLSFPPAFIGVLASIGLLCGGAQVHKRHAPRSTTLIVLWLLADSFSTSGYNYGKSYKSYDLEVPLDDADDIDDLGYSECERKSFR